MVICSLVLLSCSTIPRSIDERNVEGNVFICRSDSLQTFKGFKYKLMVGDEIVLKKRVPNNGVFTIPLQDSTYYDLEVYKKGFVTRINSFYGYSLPDTLWIDIRRIITIY
jgi:hypothetical protein